MTLDDINNFQPEDLKKIGAAPLPVKLLAASVMAIIVAVLGYFALIEAHVDLLDKAGLKEQELKSEFERKQAKASNLQAYESQLTEMQATFGSMLKSLPDKAEVESLLVEISRAGSSNNLKINVFSPSGESPKEFYAEYPITMVVEGSYGELTGFVSSIAALQRIVTLHNVSLKPLSDDSGEANVSFTAKTYRYLSDDEE